MACVCVVDPVVQSVLSIECGQSTVACTTIPPLLYIPGPDCSHLSLQQWEEMLSSSAAPEMEVVPTQNTHNYSGKEYAAAGWCWAARYDSAPRRARLLNILVQSEIRIWSYAWTAWRALSVAQTQTSNVS